MTYPWFAVAGLLVLCAGFLSGSHRRGTNAHSHMPQ
ncbi:hypothetical protein ANRL2_02681 [Anaerolineae bacterium]|nr:hypothetical protein ANRL2_02681 [Anaerolineae bacterium]